jgi:hypothetical protein
MGFSEVLGAYASAGMLTEIVEELRTRFEPIPRTLT